MEQNAEWAGRIARQVGDLVQQARRRRHLSAQALADRCAELGLPIERSVIAKLERGLRQGVSLAEVLVLARALEVPPMQLMLPIGHSIQTEIQPGAVVDTWKAAEWIEGTAPFPTDALAADAADDETDREAAWLEGAAAVRLWREHANAVASWHQAVWRADQLREQAARHRQAADEFRAQAANPGADEHVRELASVRVSAITARVGDLTRLAGLEEQKALSLEDKLRGLREQMRRGGITRPPLTGELGLESLDARPPASELERVLAQRLADHDRRRAEGGAYDVDERDARVLRDSFGNDPRDWTLTL